MNKALDTRMKSQRFEYRPVKRRSDDALVVKMIVKRSTIKRNTLTFGSFVGKIGSSYVYKTTLGLRHLARRHLGRLFNNATRVVVTDSSLKTAIQIFALELRIPKNNCNQVINTVLVQPKCMQPQDI